MTSGVQGPSTVDEYVEWNRDLLSRRAVSRRSLLLGGAAAMALVTFPGAKAAFAATGGVTGSTSTVVSGRHLSWVDDRGGDPTNAMRVTAQLSTPTGDLPRGLRAFLELGDRPGQYGRRIEADIVHLLGAYVIPNGPAGNQFYVKALIDRLRPGTVYHYRLRLSDGATTGDAYFTTAPSRLLLGAGPAPAPFTFTAFADVGTNKPPTDPRYAWGNDPAVVTAANGTWPSPTFDDNYYSATDPIAGPTGRDKTPAETLTNAMGTQRPVFTLLAGDICYADPSGSGLPASNVNLPGGSTPPGKNAYNPYVWDVFLRQLDAQSAFSPWMFATGNHDMEALYGNTKFIGDSPQHGYQGHAARLDLPKNGPKTCPSVYSFTYANVGVISVDANDLSYEIQTNTGYSQGAQLAFLERTLREWRTDPVESRRVDFVIAFFHHCAYSTTANHASDGGVRGVVDNLFSKYRVDLAVQGHNHLFERTDPIKNGKRTVAAPDGSTINPDTDGTTFITVGSGGRPRYPFQPAPSATAPPPAGVVPTGPQALPEGQRYRGYQPPGGPNTAENNTENVVNSYVWSNADTKVNASGYPAGTKVPETIEWSQVRYDAYAFIAVDVKPGRAGAPTTMTIRTLADALPGSSTPLTEIDRVTLRRTAGRSRIDAPGPR